MKKSLFLSLVLALAFFSCAEKDVIENNSQKEDGKQLGYLAVSLVNVGSPEGRATSFGSTEDGVLNEDNVTKADFYFFDSNGDAKKVDVNNNFKNVTISNGQTSSSGNVSHTYEAVLVIEKSTDGAEALPSKVVVITNPTISGQYNNQNLSTLASQTIENTAGVKSASDITADGFTMATSVYYGTSEVMNYTAISETNYQPTEELAKGNPLKIYIERPMAKVRLNVNFATESNPTSSSSSSKTIYKLKATTNGSENSVKDKNGNDIYLQLLGWDVTTNTDKYYLVKNIADWSSLTFTNWNDASNSRSYWAYNPTGTTLKYHKFNESGKANSNFKNPTDALTSSNANFFYVNENAASSNAGASPALGSRTQVIVYGELCKADGTTLKLAQWGTQKFEISETSGQEYNDVLSVIAAASGIYKQDGNKIGASDLKLVKMSAVSAKADGVTLYDYMMYPQLNATTGDFYKDASHSEDQKYSSIADVNKELTKLPGVKVWNSGHTYYYFDIAHPGVEGYGDFGVVRNHIYDCGVVAVAGLGTPVPDDNDEIIPKTPEDDYANLAVEINVLSWKMVSQGGITLGE